MRITTNKRWSGANKEPYVREPTLYEIHEAFSLMHKKDGLGPSLLKPKSAVSKQTSTVIKGSKI